MIKKIRICSVATYGEFPVELDNLKEINFIYGANGTGKTTIARVISDCDSYPDCALSYQGDPDLEHFVYNRDFVERNFGQSDDIKGIFTLGEQDKEAVDKIKTARNELNKIKENISQLKKTLEGEEGNGGKRDELAQIEKDFRDKSWSLKQKYDSKFQDAFAGVRNSKENFKAKLLEEGTSNTSSVVSLSELEKKATSLFGESPEPAELLVVLNGAKILAHERNPVLEKKVIGKTDVDIAELIEKLGNSDWVKQGHTYYHELNQQTCPFCQQQTPATLEHSLNEYFGDTFEADISAIEMLYTDYGNDAERLQDNVQALLDASSKFLDTENFAAKNDLLASRIQNNIQKIKEKKREPSTHIELESLKDILDVITTLVNDANDKIREHNNMVSDLQVEKMALTNQVWRYLLDNEIKTDLLKYKRKKSEIEEEIASLTKQIENVGKKQREKELKIQILEQNATSIQPTIDRINGFLESFGFTGFALAKSSKDRFYKIQRSDGSDAKETLSEGERSFITFLYFYHLLKGSESENGIMSDRVVVFDDPVSSMDSDILFVVSTLIRDIFAEIKNGNSQIKQVFVLTHNVYFHKEVSFDSKRHGDNCLSNKTFWTVRKSNSVSTITRHQRNPIKTSYELLWSALKVENRDNLLIQNTLRRIIEYYFRLLGGFNYDDILRKFGDGVDKQICGSLFAWINDGSHSAHDSLYVTIDDSKIDKYLDIFKRIFVVTDNIAHYNMMMGDTGAYKEIEISES